MIRNEAEYQETSKRLSDELKRLDEHRARLKEAGLRAAKILDALHVRLRTQVAIEPLPPFPVAHAS